jgi:membrane-bound lytic murein transglycosylase D
MIKSFFMIFCSGIFFRRHRKGPVSDNVGGIPNIIALILLATQAYGQIQPDSVVVDSLEVAVAEESILYKSDTIDFIYYALPTEMEYIPGDDDPDLLSDRLSCLEKTMPLIYNERVHAFINYFTVRIGSTPDS